MTHLVAAILGATALLGSTPADDPPPPAVDMAVVQEWISTQGPAALASSEDSGLSPEALVAVEIGSPIRATTWSQEYLDGTRFDTATTPIDTWLAPLHNADQGIGAMALNVSFGEVVTHTELWDSTLGTTLLTYPNALYVTEGNDVWFRIDNGIVGAASSPATELLAGDLSVQDYQSYVAQRLAPEGANESASQEASPGIQPVVVAAIAVGLLLAAALFMWWLRRPEGNE